MSPLNDELIGGKFSAEELIARGKREMLCSQISNAVEYFQMACQLLAEKHGDLHDDLAVPNLLYGTALLKLSRSENNILSEVLEKHDESEPSSEEDCEKLPGSDVSPLPQSVNENSSNVREADNADENADGQTEKSQDKTNFDDEGVEEVSTLQLAWEVVEVAKNLFNQHDDPEHQLKASDCLEKLAEIGQEIGNYEQAVSDLLECLEIRSKFAPEHDRLIAETHFQLAISYSQIGNIASSDASFADALNSLSKCKFKLESQLEENNKQANFDKSKVDELEMQIKEVSELIADVSERRKENVEHVQTVEEQLPRPTNKDSPIEDISHLIKKKRRPSDEAIHQPTKSAKIEGYSQETKLEYS